MKSTKIYIFMSLSPRWTDYGSGTRRIIGRGALYSGADYVQAQRFRSWFSRQTAKVMADVDLLVTPTWATAAQRTSEFDLEKRLLQPNFTAPFNLVGYPALALPVGFDDSGIPLSGQIVGSPFDEELVLRAGHAYQQQTNWHLAVPAIVAETTGASR